MEDKRRSATKRVWPWYPVIQSPRSDVIVATNSRWSNHDITPLAGSRWIVTPIERQGEFRGQQPKRCCRSMGSHSAVRVGEVQDDPRRQSLSMYPILFGSHPTVPTGGCQNCPRWQQQNRSCCPMGSHSTVPTGGHQK